MASWRTPFIGTLSIYDINKCIHEDTKSMEVEMLCGARNQITDNTQGDPCRRTDTHVLFDVDYTSLIFAGCVNGKS